jgi:mono/diheme cytochrome c family protein
MLGRQLRFSMLGLGLISLLVACGDKTETQPLPLPNTATAPKTAPVAADPVPSGAALNQVVAPNSPPSAEITPAPANALDASLVAGKALHEAKCISCHDAQIYTRPDHKITSLPELQAQVKQCDANLTDHMSDADIQQVVQYLNASFYKFK